MPLPEPIVNFIGKKYIQAAKGGIEQNFLPFFPPPVYFFTGKTVRKNVCLCRANCLN